MKDNFFETMRKVHRPIHPRDFTKIPRIREISKSLPAEIRVCREHGEEETIQERDFPLNPGGSAPFAKADWVGCCDEAIDRVIEGVQEKTMLVDCCLTMALPKKSFH